MVTRVFIKLHWELKGEISVDDDYYYKALFSKKLSERNE